MNFTLRRHSCAQDGIFSTLNIADAKPFAATLEHAFSVTSRDPGMAFAPKIGPGNYKCKRSIHRLPWHTDVIDPNLAALGAKLVKIGEQTLIEFETFMVVGVPGHSNLLFHWGNKNCDSDGCILLGKDEIGAMGSRMVTSSRAKFVEFMRLLAGIDEFDLSVIA